jgi:AraC-like DNA-binding protein
MRVTKLASSRAVLPSLAEAGHPRSPTTRCRGMRASTMIERRRLYLMARVVVKRYYARQLTLETVAKALATSPRQLVRAYDQFGDRSFGEDLRRTRMEVASELLAKPAVPVADVARQVGYRQASHFARAFRNSYGVSPSVYRDELRRRVREAAERNGDAVPSGVSDGALSPTTDSTPGPVPATERRIVSDSAVQPVAV